MASTNKTTVLALNQWVLSDPFLMEDMNEDNRKIDAAFGSNPYCKLMDITSSANAQQVDLNTSSIDFTKYSMIQVFATVKVTPSTGVATYVYAKINNGGAFLKSFAETSATSRDYSGFVFANTNDSYFSNIKMELSGIPGVLTSAYIANLRVNGSSFYNSVMMHEQIGVKSFAANVGITSLNFVTDSSSVYIKAGSRFEIYGVRK